MPKVLGRATGTVMYADVCVRAKGTVLHPRACRAKGTVLYLRVCGRAKTQRVLSCEKDRSPLSGEVALLTPASTPHLGAQCGTQVRDAVLTW